MIGCDGCDKWFHWSCVGINQKNKPGKKDDWFCPDCRPKQNGEVFEDNPARLIIRLFFGFASASVFFKLNKKQNKYRDNNAVCYRPDNLTRG